jgi:Uma2 family endonuclease
MLARQPELTYSEYLAYEHTSPEKHEFFQGRAYAMAGASEAHNLISGNLVALIRPHLRSKPCRIFFSDMKLTIPSADYTTYYPDLMVVCDRTDSDPYVKQKPCLVIEILSPSTAMVDQREKLFNYQKLPSLQEYVMVYQSEIKVELYRRDAEGWLFQSLGMGESIQLQSIDLAIPLSAIYEDVEL